MIRPKNIQAKSLKFDVHWNNIKVEFSKAPIHIASEIYVAI